MDETISDEDTQAKQAVGAAAKIWRYFLRASPANAVAFANLDPPQGAGEAVFSVRDNGQTDTFLYF